MIYHDKLFMAFLEQDALTKSTTYKILDIISEQFEMIDFDESLNEMNKNIIHVWLEQLEIVIEEDCVLIDFIGNMELAFRIILLLKKRLFSNNVNIQLFEESYTIVVDLDNKTSLSDLKRQFSL